MQDEKEKYRVSLRLFPNLGFQIATHNLRFPTTSTTSTPKGRILP